MSKVLYACPFAHHTGHPPFESTKETCHMQKNGVDVTLLTFCGIREGCTSTVPEIHVMKDNVLFRLMRKRILTQWIVRCIEYTLTLLKARLLDHKYDAVYLRDGEPFPFLSGILGCKKWTISLTGGIFTTLPSKMSTYRKLFTVFIANKHWNFLYSRRYTVQNEHTKSLYNHYYPNTVERVSILPLAYDHKESVNSIQARKLLNVPQDVLVLLLFGVPHPGKNNRVVFDALYSLHDVFLICAGSSSLSIGDIPKDLVRENNLNGRVIIHDYFIPEEKKPLFFGAADFSVLSYKRSFDSTSSMLWESCAYNTPVIASDSNELRSLIEKYNTGLVFRADDPKSLRITLTTATRRGVDGFKQGCWNFTENYSPEKWVKRFEEICLQKSK